MKAAGVFKNIIAEISEIPKLQITGSVSAVKGLMIEAVGVSKVASVGSICEIQKKDESRIKAEVIGFRKDVTILMAFDAIEGIASGAIVFFLNEKSVIKPDISWLGRVIDANCKPLDGGGALREGEVECDFKNNIVPNPHERNKVEEQIDLGIKAINCFVTCCKGQRMGIFAGSGVGKSVLTSMMTKYADADVKVIGLIGERGREVKEFIDDYLGPEGLESAIVVVATGDKPALLKKQAALVAMAIAEFFRDQGKNVLCILDSVTRFAAAVREIGLAMGEPPGLKGYTPSVFSELPKLLERAGPGTDGHSITGLFTVLVDGDDHNEPIADAVRGILDGHIVLDRKIAERGRFPAVNVLKSVSRTMPGCNSQEHGKLIKIAKKYISDYENMEEIIKIGAYKKGTNPELDKAIILYEKLEDFFSQRPDENVGMEEGIEALSEILGG